MLDKVLGVIVGIVIVAAVIGIPVYLVNYYNTKDVVTCTVTDKDRTTRPKGGSDARIYTSDCGVLKAEDAFFIGHFNSADVYSSIEVGKRYTFRTIGFRFPLWSEFPNIIEVTPA